MWQKSVSVSREVSTTVFVFQNKGIATLLTISVFFAGWLSSSFFVPRIFFTNPPVNTAQSVTQLLCQVADVEARQWLRSSSSSSLIVSRTRLSTAGDPAFPVTPARIWNSLPDLVTSAPSVAVFRSRLKTHLINISYPSPLWLYSACAATLRCFGHYNRSSLLTYFYSLTYIW